MNEAQNKELDENLERLIDSVLSGEQEKKLIQQVLVKAYNIGFSRGRRVTLNEVNPSQNSLEKELEKAKVHADNLSKVLEQKNKSLAYITERHSQLRLKFNQLKNIIGNDQ